jgi:histone H3/H4
MEGDNTSTYAPKSPDLSSFYTGGPTQPAPQQFHHAPPNSHEPTEYKLEHPTSSSFAYAPSYASHQQDPATDSRRESTYLPTPASQIHHQQPEYSHAHAHPSLGASPQQQQQGYGLQPPSFAQPSYGHQFPPQPQYAQAAYQQGFPHQAPNALPTPHIHIGEMPPRKAAAPPPEPFVDPSPVKTKFPTARIKRIMQADEEVGKVAQQTPIAVGKALEMFMVQLVSKSADVAKEKGSKRVTASMLKQVVETDDQWDFLRDIVSRVEQEKEGGRAKAKTESESEEEVPEPKKKGRGGRRKKV